MLTNALDKYLIFSIGKYKIKMSLKSLNTLKKGMHSQYLIFLE